MNESGRAVRRYLDYFKIGLAQIVVLCDDIDLPFGIPRFRLNGGPGTHNGLRSVEQYLSSKNYPRLRLGIGVPSKGELLADYVLSNFSAEEEKQISQFMGQTIKALELLTRLPMAEALPAINSSEPLK
jgi:PTH1 family peptidyl-tRNA hydrolase